MTAPLRKPWAGRVAVAFGLLAMLVGAAEAGLRLLASQRPAVMFTRDARLGFRLRPNFEGEMAIGSDRVPVHINGLGLRSGEIGRRRAGALRVYVLGDSFVFGHGVSGDSTLTAVLERVLVPPKGCTAVEVVNGGVPRYGTVQEVGLFETTVDRVQPDLVLLAVFVGNDALDNLARETAAGAMAAGEGSWIDSIRLRSRLYAWARRQWHAATDRRGTLQRQMVSLHAVDPPANILRGLEITEAAIARLAGLVNARGIPFGIMLVPAAAQVYPERWADLLRDHGDANARYDAKQPNQRLAVFAAARDVPLLDLTPALTAARAEALYSVLHWTPRGHVVAADAVAEFLTGSGLLAQAARVPRKFGRRRAAAAVCAREATT